MSIFREIIPTQTRAKDGTGVYTLDVVFSVMQRQIAEYVKWIGKNVLARYDGLRGIRHVVLVGGGASLITPLLVAMYPDKVKNSSEPPHYAAGRISYGIRVYNR